MGRIFDLIRKNIDASRDPDLIYRTEQEEEERRRHEDDRRREAEIQERERREMEYNRDDYHW